MATASFDPLANVQSARSGPIALSPRVTLALDAARGLAASYVVVHHFAQHHGLTGGAGVLLRFGQEAVIVFFLLSGFVIFANERHRALHPRGYLLRRLRRIYPILLLAMAVSIAVWIDDGRPAGQFNWSELVATLLSMQDIPALKPGVLSAPFLGNSPLWSLSYEMAFYIAFPLVLRFWLASPGRVNHLVGLVCCALYALYVVMPGHFALVGAYFLPWWAGAMAAEAYGRGGRNVLALGATFGWLLALCAVSALAVLLKGYQGAGLYPALMLRHFAVAAAMLAIGFGPLGALAAERLAPLKGGLVALASVSYALYVLHYPLLVSWDRAQDGGGIALGLGLLAALSWLAERKLLALLPKAPKD